MLVYNLGIIPVLFSFLVTISITLIGKINIKINKIQFFFLWITFIMTNLSHKRRAINSFSITNMKNYILFSDKLQRPLWIVSVPNYMLQYNVKLYYQTNKILFMKCRFVFIYIYLNNILFKLNISFKPNISFKQYLYERSSLLLRLQLITIF